MVGHSLIVYKDSFERTCTTEAVIETVIDSNQGLATYGTAQRLYDTGASTRAEVSLDYLQDSRGRLEATEAAHTIVQISQQSHCLSRSSRSDLFQPCDTTKENEGGQEDQNQFQGTNDWLYSLYPSIRAESDFGSRHDTADEMEDEKEDHSSPKDIDRYVQGPFYPHRKKDCRVHCHDKCNGKRRINALMQEGFSAYRTIDVCEPNCSDAIPACKQGCNFIRQYNAQVSKRNADLELTAMIEVKRRQITDMRRTEQRKGANDAGTLIQRVERKIKVLEHKAKNLVTQQRRLSGDDGTLSNEDGRPDDVRSGPSSDDESGVETQHQPLSGVNFSRTAWLNSTHWRQTQPILAREDLRSRQQKATNATAATSAKYAASLGEGMAVKHWRTRTCREAMPNGKEQAHDDDETDQKDATRNRRKLLHLTPSSDLNAAASELAPENPFDTLGRRRGDKSKRDVEVYLEYQNWLSARTLPARELKPNTSTSSFLRSSRYKRQHNKDTSTPQQEKSLIVKLRCAPEFLSRLERPSTTSTTLDLSATAGSPDFGARSSAYAPSD